MGNGDTKKKLYGKSRDLSRSAVVRSKIHINIWRFIAISIIAIIINYSLTTTYPLKQTISKNVPFGHQLVHLCGYGLLMYCFCRSWKQNTMQLILGFGLIILAITLEFQQTPLGRGDFEFDDILANTTGVVLGYLLSNYRKY